MRPNPKVPASRSHVYAEERLAGGYGPHGAKQSAEMQLRRLTMACLLWEQNAYCDGQSVVDAICALIPQVPAATVAAMAIEARYTQKLRHVPLLLVREMARYDSHKPFVADTLARVIKRADELADFLALYWESNDSKKTLSAQVKKGLARAFQKFDEYQLAKWNKPDRSVKLRDVLFLSHAKPAEGRRGYTKLARQQPPVEGQAIDLSPGERLYERLVKGELATPDTWEVGLSAAKTIEEKAAVWTRLIEERKLGAFALLKNLRNMQEHKVPRAVITRALAECRPDMLLPIDFLRARQFAGDWSRDLEALMLRCTAEWPKLPGWSVFVVDVSGSMNVALSSKSQFSRIAAATAMTVLASEMCEHCSIYATAGNDHTRVHKTQKITGVRGFALADEVERVAGRLGGGGIFTRQVCEYVDKQEPEKPDRLIVFSDSQDCDRPDRRRAHPPARRNYIVDVSSEQHGVNYQGDWDAEITGWSEHFLRFIAAMEGRTTEAEPVEAAQ